MKRKLSKKQLGAMGLAVMMAVQAPVAAAEMTAAPETTVQETTEIEEQQIETEVQTEEIESQYEEVETSLEEENETQVQVEESELATEELEETTVSEQIQQEELQSENVQPIEEFETEPNETENLSEQAEEKYILQEDQEVLTDGWNQDSDGKFTYVKNGQTVKNKVIEIDGKYYGFDDRGIMHTNEVFCIRDSENDTYLWYRAKEDGSLYVNEWVLKWEPVAFYYYYGEDGKAASGLQEVDGTLYYFETGRRYQNTSVTVDGKSYYCKSDGTAVEIQNDSWIKLDETDYQSGMYFSEKYLYVKDGQLVKNQVLQIDGAYYGFDSDGIMYRAEAFSSDGEYYYASLNGALYVNEWYVNQWGTSYYYGEQGKRCKGIQTINGVKYHFESNGCLSQSTAVTEDGNNYYCDRDGKMHEMADNQWYQNEEGAWYYVQNGEILKDCKTQIAGKWYSFQYDGRMQQGTDTNADGSLCISTWVFDGTYWHYYGEDGIAYRNGMYKISNVNYYFNGEDMAASEIVNDNGIYYQADANGYLTPITGTGWISIGDDYYYSENGNLVTSEKKKIGDAYYVFNSYGKMYIGAYDPYGGDAYRTHEDGSLYASQWYQDVDGNWYYYDQDAVSRSGKIEINGSIYLFTRFERKLRTNGVIQIEQDYYLADENGIWVQTPGWTYKGGHWYYVKEDGTLYTGILNDGGNRYYLTPKMEVNIELKEMEGIFYNIDASGHMITAADGFYYKNLPDGYRPRIYYIEGGKSVEKGWKQINGKTYYFYKQDSNGMCPAANGNCLIDEKAYFFEGDGSLASQGWHDDKYYMLASGELQTGDAWIDGRFYQFDKYGELQNKKSGVVIEEGQCNLYDENGELLESGNKQGWSLLGGNYYYLNSNSLLKKGSYKLSDGNWYYFDNNGIMQRNTKIDDRWYGTSGAAQTGWISIAGNWYYGSPINGLLYKGLHIINGVQYYFDYEGVMQTEDVVKNNQVITISESGAVTGRKLIDDGWSCYNGTWYFYQNGKPYTGWVGAYYIIRGEMRCNYIASWHGKEYYLGNDGAYLVNAWDKDHTYYAKEDGTLANSEFLRIDGKLYYFNGSSRVAKYPNDGAYGPYGEDGSYISPDNYSEGWIFVDGNYYYKEDGCLVSDVLKQIGGDWYLFDVHGKMVTGFSIAKRNPNEGSIWYRYDGGVYYYGKDGRRCNYVGWKFISGKWYYFNEISQAASGWNVINGESYYFDEKLHSMYNGYRVIEKTLYYFDESGVSNGIDRTFTGWHQENGDWYYIRNGHAAIGTIDVDGSLYEFHTNGVWISD